MSDLSSMQAVPMFEGLSEAELTELGRIASEQEVAAGEKLFARGGQADAFYIVKTGEYALTVGLHVTGQRRDVAIERKTAGEAFGWSTFVPPHRYIYSAICTQAGQVLKLARSDLESLAAEDNALAGRLSANLTSLMGERIHVLQKLWIEEVERSIERVKFWLKKGALEG